MMRTLLFVSLLLKSTTVAQLDYSYSEIPCTQEQPCLSDSCTPDERVPYCNTDPENPHCTCGTCDQNKRTRSLGDSYVGNNANSVAGSVSQQSSFGGSSPCGNLCQQDQISPERQVLQSSICRSIGQDAVCELYTCQNFAKRDCQALEPMLQFMDPTAAPKDYFDCDTLKCIACPPEWEGCAVHAPSGCVYDSALDANQTALDEYVESKRALWRYEPPTPEGPPGEGDLCGAGETPPRGTYNVDYVPETMDAVERCICDPCYITMSDHTNRMSTGGYIEYCNLHVCGADGTRWEPSGGFAIVDEDASKSEIPAHYKTLREIADTLGLSPEVLIGVSLLCLMLAAYYLIFHVLKGQKDDDDDDDDYISDEDAGDRSPVAQD